MPYKDIEKRRAASRQWQADRRTEIRSVIHQAKSVPCADCGIKYPYYVMHFHHLGDKTFSINSFVKGNLTLRTIYLVQDEIKKCIVLCANCHALRHGAEHESIA